MKKQNIVAQGIVYQRLSKEGSMKVGITMKMLPNVKQSQRFAKATKAKNKERQTAVDKLMWGQ